MAHIKKFIAQFCDKTFATLWLESLLFSALLGIGFHSWLLFGLVFLGLSCLLNRWWNGMAYTAIALSLIWGFIAASIGYSAGGWIWALVLGSIAIIKGIQIHFRKLNLIWGTVNFFEFNNTSQRLENWYLGRKT